MIIRFLKPITCRDSNKCHHEITAKLKQKGIEFEIDQTTLKQNGYLYVNHKRNNHYIALCIYNGTKHEVIDPAELLEFAKTGKLKERKILQYKDPNFKKWTKTIPTKNKCQSALA